MDAQTPPTKVKAYSYVRFSTPEQMKGDSYDRQTKQAGEYASAHGLDLDTNLTFRDLGVPAYRGQNAERGSLADFRFAVQHGDVAPGSHLLIESFDRLSRMDPWDALPIFQEIINAGITIVTLQDRKVWNREEIRGNPWRIMESLIVMMRAHEESAIKSARVASAYERKRQQAAAGDRSKPFTRMLPAWLDWDEKTATHKVNQERADIVCEMFRRAAAGDGQHKIAHWLNEQKIPAWSRTKRKAQYWHRSYVNKILTNPAAIGTFVPHRKFVDEKGKRQRKALDAIPNYYPAVVDPDTFDVVASRFRPRGRHANQPTRSLFSGVLKCAHDGATVSRVSKGEYVYLICSKANSKVATHPLQAVRYEEVEKVFRRLAAGIIVDAPRTKDTDLEEQIRQCGVSIDVIDDECRELVRELRTSKSEAVRRELQEAEMKLDKSRDRLRELLARRDKLAPESVERKLQGLLTALRRKPFDVAAANAAMKQAIRKIVMNAQTGELQIFWHHMAEDAEPQEVPWTRFGRLPGGYAVPTQRRQRRGRKTVDNSSAVE